MKNNKYNNEDMRISKKSMKKKINKIIQILKIKVILIKTGKKQ